MKKNQLLKMIGFLSLSLYLSAGESLSKIPTLNDDVRVPLPEQTEWTVEVGTGLSFSNVRESNQDGYTLWMSDIGFFHALDEVSLEGWKRGYTEWTFGFNGNAIMHGSENHMFGLNFGPRYNFVQENWFLIPFVGVELGGVFADSQGSRMRESHGLGQDFTFMFQPEAGVKIPIQSTFYARLSCLYTHYSNAGLSEDNHRANNPIDALGFRIGFGANF